MSRFLVYLPALACPLLMLVCLAGMRRMHSPSAQAQAKAEQPTASTDQRIIQLEQELAALRAEHRDPGAPASRPHAAPAPLRAEQPSAPADRVS